MRDVQDCVRHPPFRRPGPLFALRADRAQYFERARGCRRFIALTEPTAPDPDLELFYVAAENSAATVQYCTIRQEKVLLIGAFHWDSFGFLFRGAWILSFRGAWNAPSVESLLRRVPCGQLVVQYKRLIFTI